MEPGNAVQASGRGSSSASTLGTDSAGPDAEPLPSGDHVRQSPSRESDGKFLSGKSVAHSPKVNRPFQL